MQLLLPCSLGRHAWCSTQPATRVAAAVACAWRATRQQASCSIRVACRSQAACFCSNAVYLLPALRPHGGFLLLLVALSLAMRVRLGSWGGPCGQQLYAIQTRLCRVVPCVGHEDQGLLLPLYDLRAVCLHRQACLCSNTHCWQPNPLSNERCLHSEWGSGDATCAALPKAVGM